MRTEGEDGHLHTKERGLRETNPTDTLILDFQPPQLETMNVCGTLLQKALGD